MALVVAVPGTVGRLLGRLQGGLDPGVGLALPPHIPLIEPFVAEPPFLPLEQFCWRTGHEQPSFWIELGELVLDEDAQLARLAVVSGSEHLVALRDALLERRFTGEQPETFEPAAIASRIVFRDELAIAAYRERSDGPGDTRCFVERFQLMSRYPDGSWYERDFYTLDRAVAPA
ncbi:MAG: hypothetical protein WEB04_00965 [Dehalococcoidia bacterium]